MTRWLLILAVALCLLTPLPTLAKENLCRKENGDQIHVSLVSIPTKGHINPLIGIGQQFAEMGCKVTLPIVKSKVSWANYTGIEVIPIDAEDDSDMFLELRKEMSKMPEDSNFLVKMFHMLKRLRANPMKDFLRYIRDIVSHLLKENKEGRYQPDIVITEKMFPTFIDMADVLGATPMVLNPGITFDSPNTVLHFLPASGSGLPLEMKYYQRVINYFISPPLIQLFLTLMGRSGLELRDEFGFTGHPKIRDSYFGEFDGVELTQTIPDMDHVRPLLPMKHYVGPLLPLTLLPIPSDIEQWLDSDSSDVVYFCMGTVATISAESSAVIMDAVKDQPYRVLWSLPANQRDILENITLPANVRVEEFVPQRELLLHPKVKVFISHTGASSTNEAIKSGTPVVCMPFFGDQMENCARLTRLGAAKQLSKSSLDSEVARDAIWQALHNSTLVAAAQRLKRIADKHGTKEAATLVLTYYHDDRIEQFLPYYVHLPWYQRNALDLSITRFVFIITLPYTIKWSFRFIRWAFCLCFCCLSSPFRGNFVYYKKTTTRSKAKSE